MPIISNFGNLIVWVLICAILFLFGGEKGKNVAILAILALILSSIAVGVLKYAVAAPRPFVTLENVKLLTDDALGYYTSFPSGHTSGSFAFAVVVGLKYKISFLWNLRLIYPLLVFAALVGFSRIYIGVHYPIDVLFGAIIGIICAIIVLMLENKIFKENDSTS
ncbi:MAG: phosphatase PAP2 family protein [Methanobacterium sp.]